MSLLNAESFLTPWECEILWLRGFFQSPGCGDLSSAELTWAQESHGMDQAGEQERWDMARQGNEDPQCYWGRKEGKKTLGRSQQPLQELFPVR